MARMQRSLFAQLNALAEEISQSPVKAAAEKAAGPTPSDPGGYTGASSHPTTSVDNNVQPAHEGARASEYEADVKKQQGATAVDNTPEMSQEGRQDEVQLNLNTNAKATGEDPAAEKDYKGDKDDPGTAHPAKTTDGEKYSSVSFGEAREKAASLANEVLADLINFGADKLTKESEMPAQLAAALGKKEESAESDDDDDDNHDSDCDDDKEAELKGDQHKLDTKEKKAAFLAGYELAQHLGLEKEAAEAAVREVCANTLREADEMADLFIGYMSTKSANDMLGEAVEGEDHDQPADAASGASDAPMADPAAAMGGEMPAEMGGEMPAEMGPGEADMGGEPTDDEAVQELAMALEELGIPPEALLEAVTAEAGGEGGEMAAEMPKMAGAKSPASALNEIGSAVINFKRAGRFQVKEARTKRSRQLRDIMKQHVIELVNR